MEFELRRYSKDWQEKILRNIQRDQRVSQRLQDAGWTVLRLWESEIKANPKKCGDRVEYIYRDILRNLRPDEKDFDEDV